MARPAPHPDGAPDAVPGTFGFDDPDDAWLRELRAAEAPLPAPSIGPYVVAGEVRRGGQGVVYRARDRSGQREVAVKRLLAGSLATPSMRRRFERELEVASTLDHPNIVPVRGMDEIDGSPVLVMEWVEGVEITEWAAPGGSGGRDGGGRGGAGGGAGGDDGGGVGGWGRRPARDVVEVFLKVCDAVTHAHRHGVIHRDLKPSNILVNEAGEPFVLDFGLAKILPGDHAGRSTRQFVGTLAYSSPEQLGPRPGDVDVRSDVYALGVILYELLTGRLPYEVSGGLADAAATITRVEPVRPSALVDVDRDLEAIVLKALAKKPGARYPTAEALADDLRAQRDGEPVTARVPHPAARLLRAARRHRVTALLAAAIVVVIVLAAVVSSWLAVANARQRALALEAAAREAAAHEEARREADRALAVNRFIVNMLAAVDPMRTSAADVSMREVLDAAADRLETDGGDSAAIEAAVRQALGVTWHSLGEYEKAEVQLRRALDLVRTAPDAAPREVASAANELGHLMTSRGRYDEAAPLLDEAVRGFRAIGPEARAELATALNNRAKLMFMTGDVAGSEPLWREALAIRREVLGDRDPLTASSVANLAACLHGRHRDAEAEPLYLEVLAIDRAARGEAHPDVGDVLHNLACLQRDTGRYAEAEGTFLEALATKERALGPDHPNVGFTLGALAALYEKTGDLDEAARRYREAIAVYSESMAEDHPRRAAAQAGLERVLAAGGGRGAGETRDARGR